jgi:predicted Rdx family selenoprotein
MNDHHQNQENHDHGPMVTIIVNEKQVQIHRGNQSVAEIKQAGNIPLAYDLSQIIEGILKPLSDDGHVTIKGGEEFVGNPKDSSSS